MAAVLDPARDRVLVVGGQLDSGGSPGVWALDLSGGMSWSAVSCSGTEPTNPRAYSATYDPLRDRWSRAPRDLDVNYMVLAGRA